MDKLFDDISRILASPIPRRRAMKLVAAGLAGVALAAFAPRQAAAQVPPCTPACSGNTPKCCQPIVNACCANSAVCCNGTKKCCNPGDACVEGKCKRQPPSPAQP